MRVAIARLPGAADLPLPDYATEGSAGCDLRASVEGERLLAPGERALIPTGVRIALPPGYEAQVRPRSGLALEHGITLPNAPGTVDSDYRGELKVIVAPVTRVEWDEYPDLDATRRGPGGFGHTGD